MADGFTVDKYTLINFIGDMMECIDGEWGMCRNRFDPTLINDESHMWKPFGLTFEDMAGDNL